MTTLTLTWTAPWPHPISNYTVTVTNTTSGLVSLFTVDEEQFVLKEGGGGGGGSGADGQGGGEGVVGKGRGGQCDELVFTVEAETDVGSSGTSPITTGGFPKGKIHSVKQKLSVIHTQGSVIKMSQIPRYMLRNLQMSC